MNFTIVVNDDGELKTVSEAEFSPALHRLIVGSLNRSADRDVQAMAEDNLVVETVLNEILDARAIADGSYDPSDNDTPMVVLGGADDAN